MLLSKHYGSRIRRRISTTSVLKDRWKQFDPDRPPYMFGPQRDRSTNNQLAFGSAMTFLVVSYGGLKLIEYRQFKIEEKIRENPKNFVNAKLERNGLMIEQSLIEHEMKIHRKKLGLPARTSGLVEIHDFEEYAE